MSGMRLHILLIRKVIYCLSKIFQCCTALIVTGVVEMGLYAVVLAQ
jgi:hypothetical protein